MQRTGFNRSNGQAKSSNSVLDRAIWVYPIKSRQVDSDIYYWLVECSNGGLRLKCTFSYFEPLSNMVETRCNYRAAPVESGGGKGKHQGPQIGRVSSQRANYVCVKDIGGMEPSTWVVD